MCGVFQLEVSDLLRVHPAKSETEATPPSNKAETNAITELTIKHLEEKLRESENLMLKLEQKRDQAVDDAR